MIEETAAARRSPAHPPDTASARDHLDCRIAGSRVRVEGIPPPLRARLARLLQPFVIPSDDAAAGPLVRLQVHRRAGTHWVARSAGGDEEVDGNISRLLMYLEWRLVDTALGATADLTVIHGAALSRGTATLLLVGPSGTGKTTLTLGLMGRGWQPFGDDIALVDTASLRVRAFPRCFHVEKPSLGLLPAPPTLEWPGTLLDYARPVRWADSPQPPTLLVVAGRDLDRPHAWARLTQAEAAGAILNQTMANQVSASRLAQVAVRLAAGARGCYRLNNVELPTTLDQIETAADT